MSNNKLAEAKRKKILRQTLPYDKSIKKFYVISGVNQSKGLTMPLDRELNNIHGIPNDWHEKKYPI